MATGIPTFLKRILNYVRALRDIPHVLHDVSVRLTTLERRTKQLSKQLTEYDHRLQNRTEKLSEAIAVTNKEHRNRTEKLSEAIAVTNKEHRRHTRALERGSAKVAEEVSRTNKVVVGIEPKARASVKAMSALTITLRTMQKMQTNDRTHRHDLDKRNAKWSKLIRGQVSALIRRLYMPQEGVTDVQTIKANRFQLHSQHEEDGLLTTLFHRAGMQSKRFVEIGCGRSGGNAAMFVKELGWTGLMLDMSELSIKRQRALYGHRPGMVSVCAKITPETINDILTEHGFDGEVDLFSIDIDSYEYWVLDALKVCRPRVLVVEYNALFGPTRAVTVPYKEFPADAPRLYRGASLAALEKAAQSKGYRLILCEDEGCNAFFLRDDVISELPGITPIEAFRPGLVRQSIGDRIIGEDIDFFQVLSEKELPLVEV